MTKNKTNSGYRNSGDYNSGYRNSGDYNSGDYNSGNCNSGDYNSGNYNSGDYNSGYCNSGNRNSGNYNSGHYNTGYGNSCNRSSGIFCTERPKLYLFNKPAEAQWEEIDHPRFNEFRLTKWIPESQMTDEEKAVQSTFHIRGGYLKTFEWQEAWANYWRDTDDEDRKRIMNLPNFDAAIFKEITGIEVSKKESCDGEVVEIRGQKYRLQAL